MAITTLNLPTVVTENGTGVNGWTNPTNILLVDGDFASTSDTTAELTVGTFNLNIPADSTITNYTIKVRGYRGSFNTTLQIYAVDISTGVTLSYPAAPFQGFTGTNTTYSLPATLFGTTWNSDQANAIQLKLMVDGELHLDSIQIEATYVPNVPVVPIVPSTGEIVVDEFVQGQKFQLAQSMTDSDLFAFVQSFNLPNGEEIQFTDFWGTEAFITIDQGIPGKEENVRITDIQHNYNSTGLTRLSFGTVANRGLGFIYPYTTVVANRVAHTGTAEVVISNSAPFYDRFLKKNQINALVSAPIYVLDENVTLADPAHELDFRGAGVSVANDGGDSFKKIITIAGTGTSSPVPVATSSATTGSAQATTLTWSHVSSGLNRLLVVQVATEQAQTITGITFNGVALTQRTTITNGTLRQEQWSLTAPAVGTYNIVVTMSAAAYITAGAETYTTVNQASPIGATQTGTGSSLLPSLVLNTTTDNSLVVDGLSTGTLPIVYTVGAGQISNWNITSNPNTRQGSSSVEPAGTQPDAVTMSYSITQNTPWALTAIEIKGIPGTGGGVQSVTGLNTDNTDPINPIVQISVDGVSITGDGTPGNPLVASGGGGGGGTTFIDQTPDNGSYGLLVGAVNGVNTLFTVSQSEYLTGKLQVYLNGLIQLQGAADDWQQTTPGSGTFTFNTAPATNDIITAIYETSATTVDNYTVKATVADTAPNYLDDKIEIVSADSSVTITPSITNPGGNEKISYDLSVGASSITSSLGDQFISTKREVSFGDNQFCSATSTTDGTENFLVNYIQDISRSEVQRFAKDTITGKYYLTHTSASLAVDGTSVTGIRVTPTVVLGNYVYVFGRSGVNLACKRVNKSDLLTVTTMTIAAIAFAPTAVWTDGTNIFVMNNAGAVREYSVSGTTLTFVQAITGGPIDSIGAFQDGADIYMNTAAGVITKYTLSGTVLTAGTSITRTFNGLFEQSVPALVGMFYTDANTFNYVYVQYWSDATSSGNDKQWTAVTKGFSRP